MRVFIASNITPDANAPKLAKMAEFFGCELLARPGPRSLYSIIVRRQDLATLADLPPASAILVYGCDHKSTENGAVTAAGRLYRVGSVREITRQLSGLSIPAASTEGFRALPLSEDAGTLISLDGNPFFTLRKKDGCDWFYLAGNDMADFDDLVEGDFSFDAIFDKIIPFAMFFQYIQGVKHTPKANLIIDDPGLQRRYGSVDYERMVQIICDHDFSVTIAFIPWNYRRSNRKTIELFNQNRDRLSICVHGCDHTASEFAATDCMVLDRNVSLARERMEQHKKVFRLSYDNTMVFPQGAFSEETMRVLQHHWFAGAVNSTLFADNYSGGLKVRDMITPATNHYGLPLFLRRYPNRVEDFAYDLFFGRPALMVQHSVDFADGWDRMVDFVRRLRAIEPALKWMPLGRIVEEHCSKAGWLQGKLNTAAEYRGIQRYTAKAWFKTALRRSLCDLRDQLIYRNTYLRRYFDLIMHRVRTR